MRRTDIRIVFVLLTTVAISAQARAAAPAPCATIPGGGLKDSAGNPIVTGYDPWGYNYQAMMFNGLYDNFTRPPVPATGGDDLMMKWNDAWLSNKDCDGDGKLDRHYGHPTYRGSGAWLTNHQRGSYAGPNGESCSYEYFVMIVAAPADAVLQNGVWKNGDGVEIGPAIWGEFAIIQETSNDACAGEHGVRYKSPAAPGLGSYKP